MDHRLRRDRLVARLPELGVEAMFVTVAPNVRYLSGFTGSNGQLLVGPDAAVLFTDGRYEEQSRREAPGMAVVLYTEDLVDAFGGACREAGVRSVGFEASGVTYGQHRRLSEAEGVELVPLQDEVGRLRWVKDSEEIRLLERAQEITDEAFERVVGKLAEGVTEREIAFEVEQAMRTLGADRVAFDSIVAFGESAAEPHHRPGDRALRAGDVVKLDIGCVVDGYHSDMTRTVAFGEPPASLREVHDVVRRAQEAGIEALRAGVAARAADRAAREVIEQAGYGDRFTHSLGHGVGLEIHEGPTLRRTSEEALPEGAVVTVEPGVYLPGEGGVRIEDMVLVGSSGCRALPRSSRDLLVL